MRRRGGKAIRPCQPRRTALFPHRMPALRVPESRRKFRLMPLLITPICGTRTLCPRFAFYPAESADGFAASSRCGCGNLPCRPVHSADIEHPRSGAVRRTGKSMPRIKRCGGAEASVRARGRRRAGKSSGGASAQECKSALSRLSGRRRAIFRLTIARAYNIIFFNEVFYG